MDKQSTLERMKAEQQADPVVRGVPRIFEDHFRLSVQTMSLEHAAAVAHEAVQRSLATVQEARQEDDGM